MIAIGAIGLSILVEMASSIADAVTVAPVPFMGGWEHITVIGCFGVAILWMLRERERERKEAKEVLASLLAKNELNDAEAKRFRTEIVSANSDALKVVASQLTEQNGFFKDITSNFIQNAFNAGQDDEHLKPRAATTSVRRATERLKPKH